MTRTTRRSGALAVLLVAGVAAAAGDLRRPLPLTAPMAEHQKRSMREHLAAIQAVVAALARDDLAGAARAAAPLGYSEAMGQMCEHMGAAAPGFTPMALAFHHTADGIAEAARRGDRAATLGALEQTLGTCVGCHAAYRQSVVDEGEWKRLVGAAGTSTP
jgi:hypothetical protein